jgi:uncharacterized damage-inducible protein DinB
MFEKSFLTSIAKLLDRDIAKLGQEISLYEKEELLWTVRGEIKNSAGNLCLHLCGNLQHYIGRVLGGSNYKRNRDNEFAARNFPKSQLIDEVTATRAVVSETLGKLDNATLEKEYPEKVFDFSMTTLHFLIHLHGHLNYHLGQVNYHRRLVK